MLGPKFSLSKKKFGNEKLKGMAETSAAGERRNRVEDCDTDRWQMQGGNDESQYREERVGGEEIVFPCLSSLICKFNHEPPVEPSPAIREKLPEAVKTVDETKLFVCNIPRGRDEAWLSNLFQDIGELISCFVCKRPNRTGKYFGFVRLREDVAQGIIAAYNGTLQEGFKLFIARAWEKKKKVWVKKSQVKQIWVPKHRTELAEPDSVKGTADSGLKDMALSGILVLAKSNLSTIVLHTILASKGLEEIVLRSFGNRVFLLTVINPSLRDTLEESNWSPILPWFDILSNSGALLTVGGFIQWVSIDGLPFQGRTYDSCLAIGKSLGLVLHVSCETDIEAASFNKAFLLIHSNRLIVSQEMTFSLGTFVCPVVIQGVAVADIPEKSIQACTQADSDGSQKVSVDKVSDSNQSDPEKEIESDSKSDNPVIAGVGTSKEIILAQDSVSLPESPSKRAKHVTTTRRSRRKFKPPTVVIYQAQAQPNQNFKARQARKGAWDYVKSVGTKALETGELVIEQFENLDFELSGKLDLGDEEDDLYDDLLEGEDMEGLTSYSPI